MMNQFHYLENEYYYYNKYAEGNEYPVYYRKKRFTGGSGGRYFLMSINLQWEKVFVL